MRFEFSFVLLALAPLLFLVLWNSRRRVSSLQRRRFLLLVASMACLIFSLANPYWSVVPGEQAVKGVDLVLLIDVSQSMFAPAEGRLRRIDQARNFLRNLLPHFVGSPVAVVYFAGDAQIGCPLTTDLQAVHLFLDSITPAMSGQAGTKIEGLKQVLKEFVGDHGQGSLHHRPLGLLFSDGEFFDSPESFRSWLEKNQFPVFTFLCGKGKSPVPKYDLSGNFPGAYSEVRPESMQDLSGGNFSYRLSDGNVAAITKNILNHVREVVTRGEPVPQYQFFPFLLLSFLFLLAHQFLPLLSAFRPASALVLLSICLASLGMTRDKKLSLFSQAIQDTDNGKYSQALQALQQLDKEASSEEIAIAIGNVHLLQKEFDKSIEFYKRVLAKNPGNEVARWNWEVALKLRSQPNRPPGKKPPQDPGKAPDETEALLRYFNQLEKEQMQRTNSINANKNNFAW